MSAPTSITPATVTLDPGVVRLPRTHGALALAPSPVSPAPVQGPVAVPSPSPVAAPAPDLDVWRAILERVRRARPGLASVLEHAFPLALGPSRVIVGFEASAGFFGARASEPEALEALTREIRAHFGAPTQVAIDLSARAPGGLRTVASVDAERRTADLARARAVVESHPVVQEAIRLFGAQVRDVRLPPTDG